MKNCSLNDFMAEIGPWLDSEHIRGAEVDGCGHLVLHFVDGMKNVYLIDDCNAAQISNVLKDLQKRGIRVEA
ncbi:MAG: hypothetical protein HGA96_09275 [Desulfobulbaceae bacterium]|nr:hypothetical protein [Desulfobulbaceae bacterium]